MMSFKQISCEDIASTTIVCGMAGSYKRRELIFENSEFLDSRLREKYHKTWNSDAEYPELKLYSVEKIRMEDVGYLFFDGALVEESVFHLSLAEKERIFNQFSSVDAPYQESIEDTSLNLKRRSSSNYGHWLIEFLPWVGISQKSKIKFDQIILEYYAKNNFGNVQLNTLEAFDIQSKMIKRCSRKTFMMEKLLIPSKGAIHSHIKHPLLVQEARNAGLKVGAMMDTSKLNLSKRIFISRRLNEKRHLVNNEEVNLLLESFGFQIVYPGDHTFKEQVSIFANADVVVGISGAALTNVLFCKPNTTLICLNPKEAFENFFWDIANQCLLNYAVIFGDTPTGNGPHSDFSVDINILREVLLKI